MNPRLYNRAGFTLIELLTAMAIMVIIMGTVTSTVVISGHALPDVDDPEERKALAGTAVDQMSTDLAVATSMSQMSPTAVVFTVPDRDHGEEGPETVGYEWSGTPGDPLVYHYNGSAPVTLCEDVQEFSLEYLNKATPVSKLPRVLLIVENDLTPNAQDEARRKQIESWGFAVQILDPLAGDTAFQSALADADVMYWSAQIPFQSPPPSWAFDAGVGIVTEMEDSISPLGFSRTNNWVWANSTNILNNTHEITSPFPLGPLQIYSSDDYMIYSFKEPAPGGEILTNALGYDILMAIDTGEELWDGRLAQARRVMMPWSYTDFDFTKVNADGLTLLRRAIIWAAARSRVGSVTLTLRVGPDTDGLVETRVQLLNTPEAPL